MHETPEDLARLQRVLDDTYAAAGAHLLSIVTPERRLDAASLAARLTGVQVLHLATVTARCEPRVGPVDGLFFRGRFHFGSGQNSLRFRHIRKRPQVSGSVSHGEEFAVTVHGRAVELDMTDRDDPEVAAFHAYLIEVYGPEWENWAGDAPYARIEPERMYTFHMPKAG
ncbi:MAG TPA: pyridoxamine 5'-phosphate oxidase family protein [Thermomonospora sp.]|nr:pyridoxamine 5'-phosphate oxidase family protein [Thermomonospora sp.]